MSLQRRDAAAPAAEDTGVAISAADGPDEVVNDNNNNKEREQLSRCSKGILLK